MAILVITKADGTSVPLPDPAQLSWSIQDIDADGTGRNQNGDLFRDRVAIKRKLTLSWPPMTSADMSTLLNAVTDTFFTVCNKDRKSADVKSTVPLSKRERAYVSAIS